MTLCIAISGLGIDDWTIGIYNRRDRRKQAIVILFIGKVYYERIKAKT